MRFDYFSISVNIFSLKFFDIFFFTEQNFKSSSLRLAKTILAGPTECRCQIIA